MNTSCIHLSLNAEMCDKSQLTVAHLPHTILVQVALRAMLSHVNLYTHVLSVCIHLVFQTDQYVSIGFNPSLNIQSCGPWC